MNEHSDKTSIIFPNVGSCYGHGWQQMWKYFLESLLIIILAFLISIPSWGYSLAKEMGESADMFSPLFGIAVFHSAAWYSL